MKEPRRLARWVPRAKRVIIKLESDLKRAKTRGEVLASSSRAEEHALRRSGPRRRRPPASGRRRQRWPCPLERVAGLTHALGIC
eukprot:2290536-Pleurochrysis_carterae.AAC.3